MGYVSKRGKISDWAPNHPFAHEQISFVPKEESSSINSSEKPSKANSASQDPMLPAMNGLEDALQAMRKHYPATEPQPQAPSQPKGSTTPPVNGKR